MPSTWRYFDLSSFYPHCLPFVITSIQNSELSLIAQFQFGQQVWIYHRYHSPSEPITVWSLFVSLPTSIHPFIHPSYRACWNSISVIPFLWFSYTMQLCTIVLLTWVQSQADTGPRGNKTSTSQVYITLWFLCVGPWAFLSSPVFFVANFQLSEVWQFFPRVDIGFFTLWRGCYAWEQGGRLDGSQWRLQQKECQTPY